MKSFKRISALLIILTIVMSMFTVSASASSHAYTAGKCHLRKGPGLEYSSICTLAEGTRFTKIKSSYDDRHVRWWKVEVGNRTGWISTLYITSHEGGSATMGSTKLTGSEHIRYSPSKNATSLGTISSGTKVSYYDTAKDSRGVTWYLVNYKGTVGWISSKNTGGGSSKGTTIKAVGGQTKVRKGPGLDYKTIGIMYEGESYKYADSTKYDDRGVAWYKIKFDGTTGWVSSRYTKKIK